MQFDREDADTLEQILRWRRDVRHFRREPLPNDLKQKLRAAMDLAPSVGNARPWRVIEVCDAGLRAAMLSNFAATNRRAKDGYQCARQRSVYDGLKLAGIEDAPLQLAVFTAIAPTEGHGLGRQTLPDTVLQSTAMAIHTMWLVARAENVGLGMVSIVDPDAVEKLFGVPQTWRFSAYLCLGYPETENDTPLLHREGWQENSRTAWVRR